MNSDADILARLARGEAGAFDELYERHAGPLYRFVLGYVGRSEDAEDIVQEAFLSAVRRHREVRDGRAFRSWLYAVAKNRALNAVRDRRTSATYGARNLDEERDADPGTQDEQRKERRLRLVEDRLGSLPPHLRTVYRMRADGLSYQEIATSLEVPVGTVRSRISHMVKRLRKEVRTWTKS